MGFNAVRIEWSVDGLATAPKDFTTPDCTIATTDATKASMLPPTTADTPQPPGDPTLPQDPPTSGYNGDVCSSDLPNPSTRQICLHGPLPVWSGELVLCTGALYLTGSLLTD